MIETSISEIREGRDLELLDQGEEMEVMGM